MEIKAYREGHVYLHKVANLGCCHLSEVEKEIFSYLELISADGTRKYVYENQEGYEMFEENFMSKRFTSFHEFFTTEEAAFEERGSLKLKYFVRRLEKDYEIASLAAKEEELKNVPKLADRVTVYGKYDKTVNYHEAE